MSEDVSVTASESTPVASENVISPQTIVDLVTDETLKTEASLASFKDVNGLAKSYVNLSKMLGASIRIPSEDASDEAKKEFYSKISSVPGVVKLPDPANKEEVDGFYKALGRPDSPDNYDIKLSDDIPPELIDQNLLNGFRQKAYETGMNSAQVQAALDFYNQRQMEELEAATKEREVNKDVLKKMWGADFNTRLESAKRMFEAYGQTYPEAAKSLINRAKDEPLIYHMLSELGRISQERGHLNNQSRLNFGLTPDEARAKIQEIRTNPKHPFNVSGHSSHQAAVDEMSKLYSHAYPAQDNHSQ
jgi:hypothetical protein